MISDTPFAGIAPCHDHATKVFLRLKSADDEAARLAYKVKDRHTIVLDDRKRSEPLAGQNLRLFVFDWVEDVGSKTDEMTNSIAMESVRELLDGYNYAIMAYGQNNSGKSFTMFGNDGNDGVVRTACEQIFARIDQEDDGKVSFSVKLSAVEVYCEEIRDLLALSHERKALKLRVDTNECTTNIKGLRAVSVCSLSEVLSCLKQIRDILSSTEKWISSRTSTIVKITVEQRNNDDETIKSGTLQLIDLASSDKVDKDVNSAFSADKVKKINNTMDTIENVARSLAGSKTSHESSKPPKFAHHQIPYRESCLTQLLREVMGGNYKTSVILTCSTTRKDEEETLNALNFGANMKLVKNTVSQNKSGFNTKKIYDLMVTDFNVKHANYLSRIELLQAEMATIRAKDKGKEHWKSDDLIAENKKLRAQVDSLSQLLSSNSSLAKDEEHARVMKTLMEKCENIIQLQLKLDSECSHTAYLASELEFKESREQALEAMNLRLLQQLQENEDELRQVLASNFSLKQEVEKWQNVASSRLEKNDSLEGLLSASHISTKTDDRNRRSSSSSAGSFMSQIDENSPLRKSSWFFGHSTSSNRAARQISVASVGSSGSLEIPRPKGLRNGINLNVVSGDTESSVSR